MAEVSASVALQVFSSSTQLTVSRTRQAVVTDRLVAPTPPRGTPDALGLTLAPGRSASLSIDQAQRATSAAISRGQQILGSLRALEASLGTAISGGLVSPATALALDETRVSRLIISSGAGRALTAIDRLVAQASVSGANLISSRGAAVTLQTSEFGGRVTVRPQPLDTAGLNLQDLSALTQDQAQEAQARVRNAITLATTRLANLGALRDSLEARPGTASGFLSFGSEGLFEGAVRGRLVNLRA